MPVRNPVNPNRDARSEHHANPTDFVRIHWIFSQPCTKHSRTQGSALLIYVHVAHNNLMQIYTMTVGIDGDQESGKRVPDREDVDCKQVSGSNLNCADISPSPCRIAVSQTALRQPMRNTSNREELCGRLARNGWIPLRVLSNSILKTENWRESACSLVPFSSGGSL